jgi:hypothetical protein
MPKGIAPYVLAVTAPMPVTQNKECFYVIKAFTDSS